MDEPVPLRRAAIGCLLIAVVVVALALLVRPAIFSLAPPRDDTAVVVGTLNEVSVGPVRSEVVLSRSYGWDGERPLDDGRVQLGVIVAVSPPGGVSAVAAGSPAADCPLEIGVDRLTDCDGRAWTFDGLPLDPSDPSLDRFAVEVESASGSLVADLTRSLGE